MKILNTIHEDYHMHSINYSDGMNTIDEIVQYAGKIGLKKITITDHSQFAQDKTGFSQRNRRWHTKRWKNIHNDVEVLFGVEWDLIDEEGNCCFDIQGHEPDFCILSCHPVSYQGDLKNITQAYINAIHKYHDKIKCMGHICNLVTSEYMDMEAIAKALNEYQIPVELNCYSLHTKKTNLEKLDKLLSLVEWWIYVNSDMHTLNDFSHRQAGFDYLKAKGYL
ncbi:MAG: Histidinol phosphatase [uncultured bacterium (gcode 4)]|uniref:Histidinol phosphatase n=1 Tax=uncultured bacterium (gcode 4) TaxID=1234023 RepID=K1XHX4_9BACT|nr:MAG: Histidinol phosphatase [uncultured bacterium (gcode 4)]